MSVKFIKAVDVPELINDGDTLAVEGFIGTGVAEEIHEAVENHYKQHQHPKT